MTAVGLALALALARAAPGCPAALERAGAMADDELATQARALVELLAPRRAAELSALREELSLAAAAEPAERAAAGARLRAALSTYCALDALPRLPMAGEAARARAREILDQPAFRAARADRARALRWLRALWQRFLDLMESERAQEFSALSRALFLSAAAVAAALGAVALLRRRSARAPPRTAGRSSPALARPPDARLDAARAAAARGDAGEAVRLALLAALGALEREGAVPRGRHFTNRELVELLAGAPPARREAARALSRLFDRTVYGGLPAGPAEATAALEAARALGSDAGART